MTTPEVPPSIGLVGGKYELVKLIGRGGMGSVWEARHASLGTPSAIKFIEAEYANSEEARSRFDREAKAAATIQSKHAIQIYDHGVTDDGKPYIVMELLTGEPLDKRIERLGVLTLQDTARILQHVCRGLARAHERGIVHRDLKPENIFIVRNTDDDEEVAKVLDFGIAKIQNSPGVSSSTKTGAVLGTPFYMSPEQARGLRNVDHRTDVWSLGIIAFKCVSGHLPFDGESVGDLLVKICTAPVPIPSHVVRGLPPAFDAWFMRALEREPERRFANVTELSEHLAFAAGISSRGPMSSMQGQSAQGNALSVSATVAASSPSGPPGARPSLLGPQGGDPGGSYASHTPPPAGLTAAPFTSSQPVPGVGGSRAKWIVGAALIGLAVAGAGTAIAVAVKNRTAVAASSVGVTQAAPLLDKSGAPLGANAANVANATTTTAASATTETTTAAASAADAATLGTPTPLAAAGKTAAAGKPVGLATTPSTGKPGVISGKTAGGSALPPTAAPLPPPAATTPVAVLPAPPPPPPPVKKPNKTDPGY